MLFGPRAIDAFLLPIVLKYWKAWEMALEKTEDLVQRLEIQMCQRGVLDALETFLSQKHLEAFQNLNLHWDDFVETFGDSLIPTLGDHSSDYSTCFI